MQSKPTANAHAGQGRDASDAAGAHANTSEGANTNTNEGVRGGVERGVVSGACAEDYQSEPCQLQLVEEVSQCQLVCVDTP